MNKKDIALIKIMGGLGNQMFEYAFIRAYSLKNNCDFLLDTTWFDTYSARSYGLNVFNIKGELASSEVVSNYLKRKKSFFLKLITKITNNQKKEKNACVFQKDLLKKSKNTYFEGYFQSEKYFKGYREKILEDFTLKIPLDEKNQKILDNIKSSNSVSMHIRRGDYIKLQDTYNICPLEYYKKAIQYIGENIINPNFYVFSDDINWAETNLDIEYPSTIVNINSDRKAYFDIELMKNCKHNIIANSSFSWWGAWLNNNQNKIVIAPNKWYIAKNMPYADIIPDTWLQFES